MTASHYRYSTLPVALVVQAHLVLPAFTATAAATVIPTAFLVPAIRHTAPPTSRVTHLSLPALAATTTATVRTAFLVLAIGNTGEVAFPGISTAGVLVKRGVIVKSLYTLIIIMFYVPSTHPPGVLHTVFGVQVFPVAIQSSPSETTPMGPVHR